jgi:hypothetical protein
MALKINSVNGSITINPEDGVGDVSITLPRSSNIASQEYVTTQISNLVAAAPGALDTLNELSAALGDDANFSTTVTDSLALKANSADLSTVATSGSYTDLLNQPALFDGAYSNLTGVPVNEAQTVYSLTGTEIDPTNGGIQTKTLSGSTVFTESLSDGHSVILMLDGGVSNTVTWPTVTWVTSSGNAAPTLTANDTLVFWKISTTLYGAYVGSYA